MPIPGYNVRKAAQIVAFFALKEERDISVLKLAKLMYLANRKFLEDYDLPILFDKTVSMPHGPVLSNTKNYVDGYEPGGESWAEFVASREGNTVGVTNEDVAVENFDELSRADLKVLNKTWDEFGHMSEFDLRTYTHDHCLEWEDPNGSSVRIPYERILKVLGKKNVDEITKQIDSLQHISNYA